MVDKRVFGINTSICIKSELIPTTTTHADITVGVLAGMVLIDAADESLRQTLADIFPPINPTYDLGFAFMVPVDKAWSYLEPLIDVGYTIEQVGP